MPESGILQSYTGALVVPAEGALVQIENAPLKRYASFNAHLADVDPALKSIEGFDLKQCQVRTINEGHNRFWLKVVYQRPPLVENAKVTKTFPEVAVSGKVQWKAVGE